METLICFIPHKSEMTETEKNIIWWSQIDLIIFRENIQNLLADMRKNKRILPCFQNAMKASASKNTKYSFLKKTLVENDSIEFHTEIQKVSQCLQLDETTGSSHFLDLIEWIGGSPPRRGLESLVSPSYVKVQENLKKKHVQSVIKLDKKHRGIGLQSDEIHRKNTSELRYQSEKSSLQSKNFAIALGAADAVVVKAGYLSSVKGTDGRSFFFKKRVSSVLGFKFRKVGFKE